MQHKLTIDLNEEYPFIVDRIWEAMGDSKSAEVGIWFDEEENKFTIEIYG